MTVTWAFYTREHRRHRVPGAQVELDHPADGGRHRLAVWDLSRGGISFAVGDDLAPIARDAVLPAVVLHVEGCEVRGALTVSHLTAEPGWPTRCGASFAPVDEAQQREFERVIDRLEARAAS